MVAMPSARVVVVGSSSIAAGFPGAVKAVRRKPESGPLDEERVSAASIVIGETLNSGV
jgi:hypothetical protein